MENPGQFSAKINTTRAVGTNPDLFARSVKVVAGTRNRLDLLLMG
jgi:hypothetical protein